MSSYAARPRVAATTALLFWFTLVTGLAALTVQRIDDGRVLALWFAAVTGAFAGQALAALRVRVWLATFITLNLTWVIPSGSFIIWQNGIRGEDVFNVFPPAFVAAASCGYLSLSERGAFASLWFPGVTWTLAMLDAGARHRDVLGTAMLGVFGALAIAFLHAREKRRIALWQRVGHVPLATDTGAAVLAASPTRALAQLGWMGVIAAVAFGATAILAPALFQRERLADDDERAAHPLRAEVSPATGAPCCGSDLELHDERARVVEMLPLLRAEDPAERPRAPQCTVCRRRAIAKAVVPGDAAAAGGAYAGRGDGDVSASSASAGSSSGAGPASHVADRATPAPSGEVVEAPPVKAPPPAPVALGPLPTARPEAIRAPTSAALPGAIPEGPGAGLDVRLPLLPPPPQEAPPPFGAMFVAVAASLLGWMGVQAARRTVLIRHLTRPFWPEAVDQRVSNLWHLVLVGLADAGLRAAPGETPGALAQRIGLPGMATCAAVLERARHGVGVDDADLAAMEAGARAAYAAARSEAGFIPRLASAVRWPLLG